MAANELTALVKLISSGVERIASSYAQHGAAFPSLDDPVSPGPNDSDLDVVQATQVVAAAASQLLAAIRNPRQTLTDGAMSIYYTATLGTVNELHIAEILSKSGKQGMHVEEIAKIANTDANKLARMIRYLASRHIFREVAPNVFANNKVSASLDSGITVKELLAEPWKKYTAAAHGVSALIGHCSDDASKGAAHFPEFMKTTEAAASEDPHLTPLNMATKSDKVYFEWIERPENKTKLQRLGVIMTWSSGMGWTGSTLKAYDWAHLANGSIVVDVGGGVGNVALSLAKEFSHLKYIIQEREAVVKDGRKFCERHFPSALQSGLVEYKAHDFFHLQPVVDASVFVLRFVLHDWPNQYAKTILARLREAAKPMTRVIVADHMAIYACSANEEFNDIAGMSAPDVPWPLLPNFNEVFVHSMDMNVMNLLNAQERTLGEFIALAEGAGWRLERVFRGAGADPVTHLILSPS